MYLISFDSLPNTNEFLVELSKKDANSWTVIHAKNQTKGKGYAGNEWKVTAGENLTFSFLLKTDYSFQELIYFNEWISNVICLFLKQFHSKSNVKWPNDIILNDKKVCGILIENHRSNGRMNSVIGIGMNVNQTDFNQLPKATSIRKVTDKEYDIEEILAGLMHLFEAEYSILEQKDFNQIHQTYLDNLFRKDENSTFILNGEETNGIIRDVNEAGNLLIEINQELREFKHKEIELLF
ncbi:biotin--[acetyl-CoA-carboxylase] ligase [Empedobacter brevis]|uniref:Biotin--[acetyl-CoA-carboxylase] ligase n=1 Tax=Empedobacter brevis NBRC 14943 = ATCC 43319 TaxID=1218108 RepID=A0A511NI35_9FLAO|nr:biotin--[acetyl-CoA-carboxylase] ligase [Empedobacter brevis]GEM52138.1 biotin--[acetyl-CoA-carboxylase] ligase [Empedobacter brevis NBRC 14943 = ATCC 43319]